ncbi:hypothetical protein L9F63_010108, partial [Diploptera punctata]
RAINLWKVRGGCCHYARRARKLASAHWLPWTIREVSSLCPHPKTSHEVGMKTLVMLDEQGGK